MTDKEQIIVDGEKYNKCNGCKLWDGYICTGDRSYEPNAEAHRAICNEHVAKEFWKVYHELFYKTQECEIWKNQVLILNDADVTVQVTQEQFEEYQQLKQVCEELKEELKILKNNEDLLISKLQVLWGKQIAEEQGDCKNIDYSKPRTKEIYHKITEIERTLKDVAFAQSVNIRKTKPLGDTGSPKSYKRWEARERKLLEREFLK